MQGKLINLSSRDDYFLYSHWVILLQINSKQKDFAMPRKTRMYVPQVPADAVQRGNNRNACFFVMMIINTIKPCYCKVQTIRSRTTCLLFDDKSCSFVINAAGGRQYFTCSSACWPAVCTIHK
jgi:hypothetical protein